MRKSSLTDRIALASVFIAAGALIYCLSALTVRAIMYLVVVVFN